MVTTRIATPDCHGAFAVAILIKGQGKELNHLSSSAGRKHSSDNEDHGTAQFAKAVCTQLFHEQSWHASME